VDPQDGRDQIDKMIGQDERPNSGAHNEKIVYVGGFLAKATRGVTHYTLCMIGCNCTEGEQTRKPEALPEGLKLNA